MRAELCKTCIHTKLCLYDKNILGDTFVRGFFDADDAWEKYKKWEKAGFPCDDYIPAADVQEVKHGKWESVQYGCVCSVCGKRKEQFSDNFCANCGAKMKGGDAE